MSKSDLAKAQSLFAANKLTEAGVLLKRHVAKYPADIEAWFGLGVIQERLESFDNAARCYRHVLAIRKDHADAHFNLGNLLRLQGQTDKSIEHYRQTLKVMPLHRGALLNLGTVWLARENWEDASTCFRRILEKYPDDALACNNLAFACRHLGKHGEAEALLVKALQLQPGYVAAYANLGVVLKEQGRLDEAMACLEQAVKLDPGSFLGHFGMANLLHARGKIRAAIEAYEMALSIHPGHFEAQANLAELYFDEGEEQKAAAILQDMGRTASRVPEVDALRADFEEKSGSKDKALALLQPHVEAGRVNVKLAVIYGKLAKKFAHHERAEQVLLNCLADPAVPPWQKVSLHFQLAELYDHGKRFDEAFSHLIQANLLKGAKFSPEEFLQFLDAVKELTPGRLATASHPASLPLFIVGMPRSGTSLLEQMLDSHPDIAGAGELPDIGDIARPIMEKMGSAEKGLELICTEEADRLASAYLQRLRSFSSSALRIVNKTPLNFFYLGLIQALFPGARVIHAMRDPLDTCLSCYFQHFKAPHHYSYDLSNLGTFYKGYLQLMDHWKKTLEIPILDLRYEDLVANPEYEARRVIEFCGLEWNEDCLNFNQNKRIVRTASYDQVRQPLYRTSVARWKNYEAHLEPLIKALRQQESQDGGS